jgi:hypothetical protein
MDSVTAFLEGLKIFVGSLILIFVPGLAITLVFYPRFTDMKPLERLAGATILGMGLVVASILFMDNVLGADSTFENIALGLGLFSTILFIVWFCEMAYLSSNVPEKVHRIFSGRLLPFRKSVSRYMNSRRDRFTPTAMTRVIWHDSTRADRDHIDHSYLIDVGGAIDIQQVDENKWKVSEPSLMPPPYPKTWYFELVIREFNEGDVSLIDDLQIYPVQVTRKPDLTFMGFRIRRGAITITNRIYYKTDISEIQWIYSHDFHLFPILYSEDTVARMVDRVVLKLDEIAASIKKGSRISSHLENTQKLRDEFEIVREKPVPEKVIPEKVVPEKVVREKPPGVTAAATTKTPSRTPTITEVPIKHAAYQATLKPIESSRKELQADIVRDLKVTHITPETFRKFDDRKILDIKIPENIGTRILESIRDLQDDDWLYE